MAAPDADGWMEAMDREMVNLKSHDVYGPVPRVGGLGTLKLGWVLHRKFKDGVFDKNKARVVARGNQQHHDIDYNESFSPVMPLASLHTLLALAVICGFDIIQFDITSAHLHGALKEEIYMGQPDDFVVPRKEKWVWRLKKGLYGLVQAGRTWNKELNSHMESLVSLRCQKTPRCMLKALGIARILPLVVSWALDTRPNKLGFIIALYDMFLNHDM